MQILLDPLIGQDRVKELNEPGFGELSGEKAPPSRSPALTSLQLQMNLPLE